MARRRKPWPKEPSAYILAPTGVYAEVLRRVPDVFVASSRGDTDAQLVLMDVFGELGAEVRPFDSPDGKHEASILSDRYRDAPEGREAFFLAGGPRDRDGGRFFRASREQLLRRGPGDTWFVITWALTPEYRRAIRARPSTPGSAAHGIAAGERLTMADLKRRVTRAGSPFFSRENSRGMGDRFWGPYVGPGGIFFVHRYNVPGDRHNPFALVIREVSPAWRVNPASVPFAAGVEGLREEARRWARIGRP